VIVRHYVIATAGHIDHGKSALVKALTGTDPDRLPEEKSRGITIDIGFAELTLKANDGSTIHAGMVDVPGHEDFVANMIAGVGAIDLALFTVAADDGWMPQTEEHLQILTYLGVQRAVVAITKPDLGRPNETASQARAQLRGTPFEQSPIIPVSAHTGAGLEELRKALAVELSRCSPSRDAGKARLFVDRAFSLSGIGTVVTGTLTGGALRKNDHVLAEPGAFAGRIRSLHNHGNTIEEARPGMRTAINVPEFSIGRSPRSIARGAALTTQAFPVSRTLDVLLEKSARMQEGARAGRALRNGLVVSLHCGTARVATKIHLLENTELRPGASAIAQLRLISPILAFRGDRFVIRDAAERDTLAGGVVLDPRGNRKSFRSEEQATLLRTRAPAFDDVAMLITTELARYGPSAPAELLRRSHFSSAQVAVALEELRASGQVIIVGEIVADTNHWITLTSRATTLVDEAHRSHPEKSGIELERLRAGLNQPDAIFEALIADLTRGDFVRKGILIARRSHQAALSDDAEDLANKILRALATKPFDPPTVKQIAPDRKAQETLNFLIQQRRVIEIAPDIVLLRTSFEKMKSVIYQAISENGPATVSELRQTLESSRRVIVPLLEKLDRDGFTRRKGDRRVLTSN
jgi:selenocysteine-specific elongation factor